VSELSAAARRHVETLVREWLGVPRSSGVALPELPDALSRRLLRSEEREIPHRDRWGCWEYGFSAAHRDGLLLVPEIDDWAAAQRAKLAAATALTPLWPDGRSFAVCLTHDVDLVGASSSLPQALRSMRIGLAPGGPPRSRAIRLATPPVRAARAFAGGISPYPLAEHLERSLALEQEHGVTASYFFTVFPGADSSRFDCTYAPGDRCRFRGERCRIRDVMRAVAADGFDVGLHGSYHSAVRPGLLARERERLEDETGIEIRTTRQHFLHWDAAVTPALQEAAGLRADSTLGFNRAVGFRAGASLPFRLFDTASDRSLDVLEVPLVLHDGPLLRNDGLELDLALARETMQLVIDRIAAGGGVATLLFHPNNLADDDFRELYEWAVAYVLDRGAWVASLRDIDEWWRRRAASLA
jgi:peptidoglycan/xylan/chitin deacetylase (PgdA/CDA1 family)